MLESVGHVAGELFTLSAAAAVVPQHRRAQDLVLGVEQHSAMHLARQAHRLKPCQRLGMVALQARHHPLQCGPPVARVLLGPQRMRVLHGERLALGGDHLMLFRQQQGFEFGGAEIEAEEHGRCGLEGEMDLAPGQSKRGLNCSQDSTGARGSTQGTAGPALPDGQCRPLGG